MSDDDLDWVGHDAEVVAASLKTSHVLVTIELPFGCGFPFVRIGDRWPIRYPVKRGMGDK